MAERAIAIDGPSGAGKSTTARLLARELDFKCIDTGAMYRAVALAGLRNGLDFENEEELAEKLTALAEEIKINFSPPDQQGRVRVYLKGEDVTEDIRKPEVDQQVSRVASIAGVREVMLRKQRELAKHEPVVMDGRDIGTRVLPDAELKIFLTASLKTRARRRFKDHQAQGEKLSLQEVENRLKKRDARDRGRSHSPLRRAADAIEISTDNREPEEVVRKIKDLFREVN